MEAERILCPLTLALTPIYLSGIVITPSASMVAVDILMRVGVVAVGGWPTGLMW